jgi:hypothetical protein
MCRTAPDADSAASTERYDDPMQWIEIDPELNRLALAEAAKLYPEFAEHASHVMARSLEDSRGNSCGRAHCQAGRKRGSFERAVLHFKILEKAAGARKAGEPAHQIVEWIIPGQTPGCFWARFRPRGVRSSSRFLDL